MISLLFACQFCTCSLDYACCILLGSLTQRDLRRRKSKKYVIFSPCDLCVCIVQLIAASFVVLYASVLPSSLLLVVLYIFVILYQYHVTIQI